MVDMKEPKLVKLESTEKYQRLINKDLGSSGLKSGHVTLKPGENIGEHSTNEREEIIIVLKGKGEAVVDKNKIFTIKENHALYIPPQTSHDIKNSGKENLEYVFVTSKAQAAT